MLFHTHFWPIFLALFFLFNNLSKSQACDQIDRDSLLTFSLDLSLNWSSSNSVDCCSWEGVSCDDSHNKVIGINLPNRGLRGKISSSLQNLTFLSHVNLSQNFLSGPLPDALFTALNQLQTIDLSSNRLSGELNSANKLPVSIQTVNLSGNLLNGTIPNLFLQSARNLTSFNVRNNSFTGPIPPSICVTSPSIKFLDFSLNDFIGQIPTGLGGCSKLEIFRAGSNKLEGSLPRDIYIVTSLQEIFLPANGLGGTLDETISNLTNLRVLNVFGNNFVGTIPYNIGELSKLENLQLHINNFTGTIPASLMNCTNLMILNLRVNKLYGKLSDFNFSRLLRLTTLDLGNNNFTGNLPETLYACKSLVAVRFAYNSLEGEISPKIVELQSLSFLSISVNNLTNIRGAVGILRGFKNLTTLALAKNFFGEKMPDDMNLMDGDTFQSIKVLAFGACQLTGRVPNWLVKLKRLEVLDFSYNRMKGFIPGWLGNFSNLFYLDLSYNELTGGFPLQLIQLPRLTSKRQIIESILELPVFVNPNNISLLEYNQLDILPPTLNLQNNSLNRSIPVEIGQLNSLHALDLSCNEFSGNIPNELSNLTNLESLNLASNNLSGQIPTSLKALNFLSSFSVANNNLQGPIPTGGQFDIFPNTSFEGNPELCGPIIHRPCSFTPDSGHPSRLSKKSPNKKIITGLIVGICLGVGFTLITLALCILTKGGIFSRGKTDKVNADTISLRSNSGISTEFGKDASLVMVFPNNTADIKNLSIHEILKATDNFNQENIIGCGGFGLVYKATLENGTKLAIKKLSGDMGLMEREFRAEVEALSTAQHMNLVTLQGYCIHDGFRILMYSYMENGSLDYWLHEKVEGGAQLDWPTRLRILQGVGCGLTYMHQICEPHIVHRDIKSSNILLDDKFEAHVADFGLSRLIQPYHTHVTTELVGTLGYIPPEYGQSWIATLRGDMYSFGVVMLELLTRKRPVEVFKPKVSRELVVWVQQLRSQGKQNELFDPILKGKGFEEEMTQVLDVACMCVNENPLKRPTITEVVDWLDNVGANRKTPKE